MTINNVNKKIYVGVHKTSDPYEWDYYLGCGIYANKFYTYEHPKTTFQYAVKKYGPKNFTRKTLAVFNNEEDAFLMEANIVNKEFLSRKDVYNMVLGGKGGDLAEMSVECHMYTLEGEYVKSFNSMQDAADYVNRGRTTIGRGIYQHISAGGYFWSLDKVEKLDLTLYKTDTNKKVVYMYSATGLYEKEFESVSEASRETNIPTSNISRAVKLGYMVEEKYFSFIKSDKFAKAKTQYLANMKVYQYDLEGNFIAEYETIGDAKKKLQIKSDIGSAIKKGTTCAGYQWSIEKLDKMPKIKLYSSPRRVGVYDLDGNLVETFNTVTECQKKYSSCKHVLHGKRKTGNGHIFKYLD